MKAIELYKIDQAADNGLLRKATPRRDYYTRMRTALQDEANGVTDCQMISDVARAVAEGQDRLYLLDAGALWECYDAVIGQNRFPRDLSRGFPFKVKERTLPWSEVQRLSDSGRLAQAVVDAELRARVEGLYAFVRKGVSTLALPLVNERAQLETADPEPGQIPQAGVPAAGSYACAAPAVPAATPMVTPVIPVVPMTAMPPVTPMTAAPETSVPGWQPAYQDGETKLRMEEMKRENQKLTADNNLLRGQLDQMRAYRESERDYAVRAARCILGGHMEEARVIAEKLGGELQTALLEMERIVSERFEMEQKMEELRSRMEADVAQTQALRQQQAAAHQAVADAREEREKAMEEAAQVLEEKKAAEAELAEAQQELAEKTRSLRELRLRMVQTGEAIGLTQRQLESLSEFL